MIHHLLLFLLTYRFFTSTRILSFITQGWQKLFFMSINVDWNWFWLGHQKNRSFSIWSIQIKSIEHDFLWLSIHRFSWVKLFEKCTWLSISWFLYHSSSLWSLKGWSDELVQVNSSTQVYCAYNGLFFIFYRCFAPVEKI